LAGKSTIIKRNAPKIAKKTGEIPDSHDGSGGKTGGNILFLLSRWLN